MKTNKPLEEAIFRAPETTDESKQAQQEKLYHMGSEVDSKAQPDANKQSQDLVNESHVNRMESLQQLRELEYEVEKKIKNRKK